MSDPSTITGKLLWLRGKDLTGAVGSTIATWPDNSGLAATVTATLATVCDSADAPVAASAASSNNSAGNNSDKAFDGSGGTTWITAATPTGWLRADMATAKVATSYGLTSTSGAAGRMAKDWTFEGSNDASTWTVLDTRTAQTGWAGTRYYDFTNTTAYLYYRLNVTANNGDATYLSLAEMTIGVATPTKGARFIGGRLDGGVLTGGASREVWFVADSRILGNSLTNMGAGGSTTYYPYTDGKIYDDTFISTRQSFTPTMQVTSRMRLVRITMTGGVWTYYLDNVQQATFSAQTFSVGATRRIVNSMLGTVHEALLLDAVSSSSQAADLITYFNTEHGLSVSGGSVSLPTTTGTAPVSVASSSASRSIGATTGSAPVAVSTSSASSSPAVTTTGTSPVAVASYAATAPVVPALTTGTAPISVESSAVTTTVGATVTTGTSPVTVGTSSASTTVVPASGADVQPWTADPSGQGQFALDIPDGVIRIDPPLAVAPPNIAERPIRVQVQSMPTLTQGPDGQWRSDGTYTTTQTVLGVPHLFVDGLDVTYLRGFPSQIYQWSHVEPGGEETAVIGFPQVMPFESTGEAGDELYWLNPDRDCEIAIVEADGTRHYVWSGIIVSEEQRLTATNSEKDWHARGVLFGSASAVKHRPPTWMPPTDIGTVIPDILNAVPSRRYEPIPRVVTGILTTDRGSSQDSVWDHTQRLLATAWTTDGRQWTVRRVGRARYEMVLKDDTPVYSIEVGTPGVEHTLTRDKTQAPNIIWGRGVGPDGYGWGRWYYPNLDFGAGIDAAYLDGAYRLPLAADPKVQPGHPEYDPKVLPTEIEIDFGTGITLDEAIRSAEMQLGRDENAGMSGSITVRTDPAQGSRVLWQAGEVLEYRNLRGGDFSTGFAEWRMRPSRVQVDLMGDGIPVSLTVDSKARDAMSLVSILKRDKASEVDPARRPGALNRRSRQEQDAIVEYDGEARGGIVPSHYVPARTWVCFWRPISQVNRIVKVDYYSESRFALALFGGDVTPSHLDALVGDPLAIKAPYDVNFDALTDLGYIEAWGELDAAAGYSPHTETTPDPGPFTGRLLDTNSVEYVAYQNLWVKVCEWSADGGVMSGSILPAVNA